MKIENPSNDKTMNTFFFFFKRTQHSENGISEMWLIGQGAYPFVVRARRIERGSADYCRFQDKIMEKEAMERTIK